MVTSTNRQRVYLHIGVPKSGTTFLQAGLAQHRKPLRRAGVLYPGGQNAMFRAALDVRGNHKSWGRKRAEVAGSWDRLCRIAHEYDGSTVLSHELLAAASLRQIDAAWSMLQGLEVHVVVTARDPARQLTAEWQEGVKHGRSSSFGLFSSRVLAESRDHEHARRFWAAQDLLAVLERWGSRLPPERVHVVCCPSPSADPALLWRRFAGAVGFDAAAFGPPGAGAANSSLGAVQIDLLRRVNAALDGRLVQPGYGRVVKQYFTRELLARHQSARPQLPLDGYEDLAELGERWAVRIDQAGYTVHGDLAELVATPPDRAAPHPDDVDARTGVETAAAVVAELLLEVDRLRAEVSGLEEDKKSWKKKRRKLKERLAQAGDR